MAARLQAGLTGDAIALEVDNRKLVCWKPAFGGRLVAAIRATSPTQMVTVRPGVLPRLTPRPASTPRVETHTVEPKSRVRMLEHKQNDQLDALALATRVVGIGVGIPPQDYDKLDPLLQVLQAELATTRKVTDKGWLPHSRQVGITGRSIAPNLYIALAVGGKFNHSCGIQASGTGIGDQFRSQGVDFQLRRYWHRCRLGGVCALTGRSLRGGACTARTQSCRLNPVLAPLDPLATMLRGGQRVNFSARPAVSLTEIVYLV